MWIYSFNYARAATSTWLVGRLMWTESHIPVVLLSSLWDSELRFPGSHSSPSAGIPGALALVRCWILALSSMVKSCRPRDFVTKSSTLELLPPCWAAKGRPWGSQPLACQRCWILSLPFPARLKESYFTQEQTWKRNRDIMVLEYFWNCFSR